MIIVELKNNSPNYKVNSSKTNIYDTCISDNFNINPLTHIKKFGETITNKSCLSDNTKK